MSEKPKMFDPAEMARRVYRKRGSQPSRGPTATQCADGAGIAGVNSIRDADRAAVKKRRRTSIPQNLLPRYLGRYMECGSIDGWTVCYSIERRNGEWKIRCVGPEGERESSAFADVAALVEDARDRGYCPEDLLRDLRRTRRAQLVTLAGEVEEIARAKG